jgi:hypothetical protein
MDGKIDLFCGIDHSGTYVLASEANKRIKVLEGALDGLLDGLDANSDGREGFTNIQWQKRIAQAHKALEVKP